MELYYIIHFLVFVSCLFELSNTKTKFRVILLWCVFFTLFGGLRWETGGDWDQYLDHFLYSDWNNIFSYDRYGNGREQLEPMFVFLNALIKTIFGKYFWLNIFECGFIQFTIYHFCKQYSPTHPILLYSWIIVAAFNYFPVRMGLAMSVGWWCFQFSQEQRLKPFLITAFIASSLHNGCIILFPLYWIGKFKLNFITYSIIYLLVILIRPVIITFFISNLGSIGGNIAEKALFYTQEETVGYQGASYMSWGLNYILTIIFYWVGKKQDLLDNRWYQTLINVNLLYMTIFVLFSEGMGDLTRLAGVISPAFLILYIYALNFFINGKNVYYRNLAILFYVLYYGYKILQIGQGYYFKAANVPYRTIFDFNIL